MKDKDKELQTIYREYKTVKSSKEETPYDEEELQEKSVINPELTLKQVLNLKEKDLNIQMMVALIRLEEEIQKEEKKINTKIKKIKTDIGNFRYEYDDNGVPTNADQMQKMSQKFEKARTELSKIKKTHSECKENLLDFEEKTGLTTNNVKEMIEKQERQKREYEEQEKIRKAQREEERRREQEAIAKQKDLKEQSKDGLLEGRVSEEKYKEDIITIFPNQNRAVYIFDGKEGKIEDIRQVVWGEKPNIFGKYKIKEEEYVLTNNNTGEEKEYRSKLNPVVFEILKTNPEKLEEYMNLLSTTSIIYFFDEDSKENKDVVKMMYRYQKEDRRVTQKIGSIGLRDRINSRIAYKLGSKQPLLLEAGNMSQKELETEESLNQNEVTSIEVDEKKTKKQLKAERKQQKQQEKEFNKIQKQEAKQKLKEEKQNKKFNNNDVKIQQEEYNYENTRTKMETFREQMRVSANTNIEENIDVDNNLSNQKIDSKINENIDFGDER